MICDCGSGGSLNFVLMLISVCGVMWCVSGYMVSFVVVVVVIVVILLFVKCLCYGSFVWLSVCSVVVCMLYGLVSIVSGSGLLVCGV